MCLFVANCHHLSTDADTCKLEQDSDNAKAESQGRKRRSKSQSGPVKILPKKITTFTIIASNFVREQLKTAKKSQRTRILIT